MARVSRHLGDIGYKNTDLIPIWFDKLERMVEEKENTEQNLTFEQAVFGGFKNFAPRHYIFKGFESNDEFALHLQTVANYEEEKDRFMNTNNTLSPKYDEEARAVEEEIMALIDATKELKDIQTNQQAAIDSLRDQYFKLQIAYDEHKFLQDNDYVRLELLELQELLVKGGYINPDEVLNLVPENHMDLNKRMEAAS